ncbi:MAG: hypothetical protein LUD72_10250 [Bacteroidales bacterium]|nr:hypothetical protein [Bacteroidales bacterium]
MKIKKRDKTVELFSEEKVHNAIAKAFEARGREFDPKVLKCVLGRLDLKNDEAVVDVEEIQDIIEECLMNYSPDIARAFIIYRYQHKSMRENQGRLTREMSKKLMALEIENQNANIDEYSFGGRMGEAMRVVTKDYALNYCMSKKSKRQHLDNQIYQHDLDSYSVGEANCLSVPFDNLFESGFNTRQTDVRQPKSINTAMQLVAVLFQLQSLQQFGGVSATHLDWTMVPFVRKSFYKHYRDCLELVEDKDIKDYGLNDGMPIDCAEYKQNRRVYSGALKLTEKELKQATEGMYHNLNTLQSRSGQTEGCRLAA